jgi:hypothetical protein
MRSARMGGLSGMGKTRNGPQKVNGRNLQAHNLETRYPAHLKRGNVRMNRAIEYANPTHNAKTTRAYSVSFPVCIA